MGKQRGGNNNNYGILFANFLLVFAVIFIIYHSMPDRDDEFRDQKVVMTLALFLFPMVAAGAIFSE
jgi:hypothetical protein